MFAEEANQGDRYGNSTKHTISRTLFEHSHGYNQNVSPRPAPAIVASKFKIYWSPLDQGKPRSNLYRFGLRMLSLSSDLARQAL